MSSRQYPASDLSEAEIRAVFAGLLLAMLRQTDAGARSLLQRAGANVGALTAPLDAAVKRLPEGLAVGDGIRQALKLLAKV